MFNALWHTPEQQLPAAGQQGLCVPAFPQHVHLAEDRQQLVCSIEREVRACMECYTVQLALAALQLEQVAAPGQHELCRGRSEGLLT